MSGKTRHATTSTSRWKFCPARWATDPRHEVPAF